MNYILRKGKMPDCALRDAMVSNSLSSGAKVLYSYLFGLKSGEIVNTESFVKENVAISRAMVNNFKRELKELGLLHENKDGISNIRFMYLGSLRIGAIMYAEDWKRVPIQDNEDDE